MNGKESKIKQIVSLLLYTYEPGYNPTCFDQTEWSFVIHVCILYSVGHLVMNTDCLSLPYTAIYDVLISFMEVVLHNY